jgi:hypothetical protein
MKPRKRQIEDQNQGDEGIDSPARSQGNEGPTGQADVERDLGELQPVGSGPGGVERERDGQREGER